jgi:hypothetical protein
MENFEFGRSSVPHDPHGSLAAVISGGQPTVVHVTIVSPLASQHAPYRHCRCLRLHLRGRGPAALDGLTGALGLRQACCVLDELLR